jgi:trehalose/maltose transport system substrate-binding protein
MLAWWCATVDIARGISVSHGSLTRIWRSTRRQVLERVLLVLLPFGLTLLACNSGPSPERHQLVTINFLGWWPTTLHGLSSDQREFSQFTQQSGIDVHNIPGPETSTDKLKLYLQLLESKSNMPDVYFVDAVWLPGLAEHLVDLRPYLGEQAKEYLEADVQTNTVNGGLVGVPFMRATALLYYREDLLHKYGYRRPPETWDELETMAARIQAGERAAGNLAFWGFVWQGAAYEGLTCDALEWQASHGGGRIVEEDGTISVNNSKAIGAMKRARRWVGTISPPSVTEFREADSRSSFDSGNAAFARGWITPIYSMSQAQDSPMRGKVAATLLPSGRAGRASVVGGESLAVSKYSAHPREAIEFVRYLTSREVQMKSWNDGALVPARNDVYQERQHSHSRPDFERLTEFLTAGTIARPSAITGKRYAEVSRAYFSAVHSIITGEVTAERAMADLESEIVQITGFKPASRISQFRSDR